MSPPKDSARVLVVEDDPLVSHVVAAALAQSFAAVRTAAEGAHAMRLLDEERFDVVITDLKMPGIGGLEVVRYVHERLPDARVIVITGFASPEDERRIGEVGAVLLRKPFGARELADALARSV